MEKSSKMLSNILIALLIIGSAYFGYLYFFDDFSFDSILSLERDHPTASSYPEFVSLLSDLRDIDLDEGSLTLKVINSLQDFSVDIPTRLIGRFNPFAPLGTSNRITGTTLSPVDTPRSFEPGAGTSTTDEDESIDESIIDDNYSVDDNDDVTDTNTDDDL